MKTKSNKKISVESILNDSLEASTIITTCGILGALSSYFVPNFVAQAIVREKQSTGKTNLLEKITKLSIYGGYSAAASFHFYNLLANPQSKWVYIPVMTNGIICIIQDKANRMFHQSQMSSIFISYND